MKHNYIAPIITVEEIVKQDVLCSSDESDTDNQFIHSQNLLNYVFSGEWKS